MKHEHLLRITNDRGHNFNVRLVRVGQHYGLNDCIEHGKDKFDKGPDSPPLVEFYDAENEGKAFGPRGQFISRYGILTLLGLSEGHWPHRTDVHNTGIDLMGYEPSWKIDATAMNLVRDWLRNQTEGEI